MMKIILYSLLIISPLTTNGLKFFRNGRMRGGNIGKPNEEANNLLLDVEEKWFIQDLDHFEPTEERTWQQRYQINNNFYKTGGPVFLMLGGEGEANIKWLTNGAWVEYGKSLSALLIQLEHRYYGKSHPTEDLNMENLKFLTSEQALADAATFIVGINQQLELPPETKWIVFGGSYSGSLAAWLRFKYPHLVHGAVSASGPLLAEVDFQDYLRVVTDSLATHSQECVDAVHNGIKQVETLLNKDIGQQNLNALFTLCDPIENSINNTKDISNFFESISGNFAGIVQYNKDNRISDFPSKNITIDTICDIMVDQTIGPQVNRLAAVNTLISKANNQTCLDYKYDNMIEEMRNISWESDAAEGSRQWVYQTCNEFGFYQTSSGEPHIFGDHFPVEFFVDQCQDIYDDIYNDKFLNHAVSRTNIIYGALDIKVTNTVFVHGSIDPWHALGITQTRDPNAPAIYINGTAHCADMYPPSEEDLPQLTAARSKILKLITSWLTV